MTLLLVVAFPFSSAAVLAILGRRLGRRSAGAILVGGLALAFATAVAIAQAFAAGKTSLVAEIGPWLPLRGADLALRADPATVPLLVTLTAVAAVLAFSAVTGGDEDVEVPRFGAAFALSVGGAALVVVAANLMLLFAGWELVAVGTYLLVAHRRDRPAAAAAGLRSFVVARVGDAAFLVAVLALLGMFHTVDIAEITQHLSGFAAQPDALARFGTALFVPSLLVVIAALARSAQLPLHLWLPDVSDAPAAASALIHALVASGGVVLIVRLGPLVHPGLLAGAAVVGALTALAGASVALSQTDLRRLLAWSTVSQLGLAIVAAGSGAAFAALFILVAHALAKATLILAAALRRTRVGRIAFAAGALTLAAVPPLAGYFCFGTLTTGADAGPALVAAALATSGLTGLHAARLMRLTPQTGEVSSMTDAPIAHVAPVILAVGAVSFGALAVGGAISLGVLVGSPAAPDLAAAGALLAFAGLAAGTLLRMPLPRTSLPIWLRDAARFGLEIETTYRLSMGPFRAAAQLLDRGTEDVVLQGSAFVGVVVARAAEVASGAHRRYARAGNAIVIAAALGLVAYWTLR